LAPTRTAFCREADLALKLYHGARLLLLEDARAAQAAAARLAKDAARRAKDEAEAAAEAAAEATAEAAHAAAEDATRRPADERGSVSRATEVLGAAASEIAHLSLAERQAALARFRETLENGVRVVKFNRRGKVAFRTLVLFGDHTLTWRAGRRTPTLSLGGKGGAELFDLRELTRVQLGEAPDLTPPALDKPAPPRRPTSPTRPPAGRPPAAAPSAAAVVSAAPAARDELLVGTATLRMHAAGKDGATVAAMRDRGECASLCWDARTVDFGCDCSAQRDTLVRGFRLLQESLDARGRR
jgi:hypothetical protein